MSNKDVVTDEIALKYGVCPYSFLFLHKTKGYAKLEVIKALRQTDGVVEDALKLLIIMQKSKSIDKHLILHPQIS